MKKLLILIFALACVPLIAEGRGEGWGYGTRVGDENSLVERYRALTNAIMDMDYICGYCYTQITDVEQEVNGLMDAQRNFKCDSKAICEINRGK